MRVGTPLPEAVEKTAMYRDGAAEMGAETEVNVERQNTKSLEQLENMMRGVK